MSSIESVPPATGNNSTNMIGEDYFKGTPKPPIKHVYKRRAKEQKLAEEISKSPPKSVTLSATNSSKEKQASEDPFKGIPNPPIKYVFKRRDKVQQDTGEE